MKLFSIFDFWVTFGAILPISHYNLNSTKHHQDMLYRNILVFATDALSCLYDLCISMFFQTNRLIKMSHKAY